MSDSSINRRDALFAGGGFVVAATTPAFEATAQSSTVAPLPANTSPGAGFSNGYPAKERSAQLYDEMDYQRAVQAYIWATTLVNSVGLARALTVIGADPAAPAMIVWDKPLSPKQVFMTGNDVSTYGMSIIDLSKTGPFVIAAPEGVLGGLTDFWQRAVLDIGVGETLKGAKLLLLPPGYGGPVPSGYLEVVASPTGSFFLHVARRSQGMARTGSSSCSVPSASIRWRRRTPSRRRA